MVSSVSLDLGSAMSVTIIPTSLSFGTLRAISPAAVKYLVVHTEGAPRNRDGSAASMHAYHQKRGWSGIGYHFVIRQNGRVERARPLNRQGAHVQGANHMALGICCSGNGDLADFTAEQKRSLVGLIHHLRSEFPVTEVVGHRPLVDKLIAAGTLDRRFRTGKTCPGTRVSMQELQELIGVELGSDPEPGTRRWSNHFTEWLILTRFVADDEWYFVRESRLAAAPTRAHARWSQMPLAPA